MEYSFFIHIKIKSFDKFVLHTKSMAHRHPIKRVIFDLNHPADFHFFKHLIRWMISKGYVIKVVARDKECLHMLLKDAGIQFINRGRGKHTLAGKYLYAAWILIILSTTLIRFRPDISMSLSSPYLVILSRLFGITCVTFDDTDENPRLLPLIKKSTYLLSPASYPYKFHKAHFRLPTLKELAYLHPSQFEVGKERSGVFFRITRTDSIHHSSGSKLEYSGVLEMIGKIGHNYPVFLSLETDQEPEIIKKIRRADPIHIHEELASCKVFWGNSATMAAEAAVLGIPAIFVGAEKFAYIKELETYGLLFYFHPNELNDSFKKLDAILKGNPPDSHFINSRELLLREKIDMTAFMIWFVENLPESVSIMEKEPDYAKSFIAPREA
jgi:predicted glycosyltransferase